MNSTPPDTEQSAHYQVNESSGTGKSTRWDCLLGNVLLDPYANRKAQDKHNICFESSPLSENCTVTGNPLAKVFIKPNGRDCMLFVYLEDVAPNGSVNYVTEGEILCGHEIETHSNKLASAHGVDRPKYKTVTPMRSFRKVHYRQFSADEVRQVDLEMFPISYQFKKGHRIRLSIAGHDKHHFKAPPFVKMSEQFEIMCGAGQASQIVLPVDGLPQPEMASPVPAPPPVQGAKPEDSARL